MMVLPFVVELGGIQCTFRVCKFDDIPWQKKSHPIPKILKILFKKKRFFLTKLIKIDYKKKLSILKLI